AAEVDGILAAAVERDYRAQIAARRGRREIDRRVATVQLQAELEVHSRVALNGKRAHGAGRGGWLVPEIGERRIVPDVPGGTRWELDALGLQAIDAEDEDLEEGAVRERIADQRRRAVLLLGAEVELAPALGAWDAGFWIDEASRSAEHRRAATLDRGAG